MKNSMLVRMFWLGLLSVVACFTLSLLLGTSIIPCYLLVLYAIFAFKLRHIAVLFWAGLTLDGKYKANLKRELDSLVVCLEKDLLIAKSGIELFKRKVIEEMDYTSLAYVGFLSSRCSLLSIS